MKNIEGITETEFSPRQKVEVFRKNMLDETKLVELSDEFILIKYKDNKMQVLDGVYQFDKDGILIKFTTGILAEKLMNDYDLIEKEINEIKKRRGEKPREQLTH